MKTNKKIRDINKKILIDILKDAPEELLKEFASIVLNYNAITNDDNITNQDRISYINQCYNSINLINKIVAICSNGKSLKDNNDIQISSNNLNDSIEFYNLFVNDEDTEETIDQSLIDNNIDIIEENNNSNNKLNYDDITVNGLIKNQLEEWGITNTNAYIIMDTIPEAYNKVKEANKDFIKEMANILNKPYITVLQYIRYIIKNADFKKSTYIPEMKRLKDDITEKDELLLLNEFIEFCE